MGALGRWQWAVLAAFGVLCLLTFLNTRTLTEHEVFAAEPAREMLAGRGWVLQPFAGEVRTKKPPGQSWLIAASLLVTRTESALTARLPSALAGLGLAAVVAWTAARVGTPRMGLVAGMMTVTCVGVQQRARLAEADMALAFCVGLANACLAGSVVRASADGRPRRRAVVFWLAVVAGFLLKGPIVFGFTLVPALAAWAVLRSGLKETSAAAAVRRTAFWWPAVLTGLAVVAAWPVAAWMEHPAVVAQWQHEIVDRMTGRLGRVDATRAIAMTNDDPPPTAADPRRADTGRRDPILSYAWLVPEGTLPWFPFALPAACWLWRQGGWRRPATVVLASWFVCGVALVTLIAFKVLHYVLPALTPVIVLAAFGFDRWLTRWQRGRPRATRARAGAAAMAGWFAVACVGWGVWNGVVLPERDLGPQVEHFAARVNQLVPAGETIYLYRVGEDRTAWYLHRPLRQTMTLPTTRPAFVVCARRELADGFGQVTARVVAEAGLFVARDPDSERRVLVRID